LIQLILDRVARMAQFLRRSDSERSRVSLTDIVTDAIALLEPKIKHSGLSIEVSLEESLAVCGYRPELEQALINLVSNALDAFENSLAYEIDTPQVKKQSRRDRRKVARTIA
jgi:C4-dicarboxylate-specific signal transduction histidine kinase